MKLTRYEFENRRNFGFVSEEFIVPFSDSKQLSSIESYLENLPESREEAERIIEAFIPDEQTLKIENVKLLPIIDRPAALIDFGLTPKHMFKSAQNLIKYEFSGLKRFIALKMIKKRVERAMSCVNYPYYKGNNTTISGDGDTVVWPSYCEYLDIEPELAFIYGNPREKIAGYFILNDLSARDVQVPELNDLSLTRSKDFDNGLSSFLVTPDEVKDPRNLKVSVNISEREKWEGDTSNYLISPEEVLDYLETIFKPATGTVVGMGTVPGCCCIEQDSWLKPGDRVTIEFEKLGSLTQHIPKNVSSCKSGRWIKREDINI